MLRNKLILQAVPQLWHSLQQSVSHQLLIKSEERAFYTPLRNKDKLQQIYGNCLYPYRASLLPTQQITIEKRTYLLVESSAVLQSLIANRQLFPVAPLLSNYLVWLPEPILDITVSTDQEERVVTASIVTEVNLTDLLPYTYYRATLRNNITGDLYTNVTWPEAVKYMTARL